MGLRNITTIILASVRKNLSTPSEATAWLNFSVATFGAIFSLISLAVASFSLYLQFFNKEHSLTAIAAYREVKNDSITIGLIFRNNGDYSEVIENASLSLAEKEDSNFLYAYELDGCFQPILVEPQKAAHHYYTIQIPTSSFDAKITQSEMIRHFGIIEFEFVSPTGQKIRQSMNFGEIGHNLRTGKIEEVEFPKNVMEFDFKKQPTEGGLGRLYVPETWKPNPKYSCAK